MMRRNCFNFGVINQKLLKVFNPTLTHWAVIAMIAECSAKVSLQSPIERCSGILENMPMSNN